MNKIINGYCRGLEWLIGAILAVLVVLVFGNVALRYTVNSGFVVTEELGRWLFVWMVFLGAIVGLRERLHLGSDLLVSRLGVTGKRICAVTGGLLMLYCTWLLLSGSAQQMLITMDNGAPVTGIPMAVFYGSGAIFGVSGLAIILEQLWSVLSGHASERDLTMTRESEEDVQTEREHLRTEQP